MKNFWYFLYFYLTIYVPLISGAARKVCIIMYFLVALVVISRHQRIAANIFRQCKSIWLSIICLTIYVAMNVLLFHADSIILTATFSMTIVPFFSVIALSTLFVVKKRTDFISDFTKVAVAASLISICLYVIPSLGKSVLFLMAGDDWNNIQRFYEEGRGYGIAGSLFYGYSIIQAIAAFLTLRSKKTNKYIYVLLILVSIILNARIGLFLFVALLIVYYMVLSPIRQTLKTLFAIAITVLCIAITGIYKTFQESLDWTLEGFYMVSDFIFGTTYTNGYGHFSGLAGTFLIWPNTIQEWIFGNGVYLLSGYKGYSSDVGLILQLNWGGLIYLFLLLIPIFILIVRSYKLKKWEFILLILISLFICDWKGDVFTQSNFLFIITALYLLKIKQNEINFCYNSSL